MTWTGASDTNWFNAGNWSPTQVPTAGDDVTVAGSSTVVIGAGTAAFNSLVLGDGASSPTLKVSGSLSSAGAVTINSRAILQQNTTQPSTIGQLTVASGGMITHTANSAARSFIVNLSVTSDFNLQAGATISVNGQGYAGGAGYQVNGNGPGAGLGTTAGSGAGGGHGGVGGYAGNSHLPGGAAGDILTIPTDLGSGGGGAYPSWVGGAGGGAVILNVGGTLFLNGLITANGTNGGGTGGAGGGAGGTINITASGISGAGRLLANGGSSAGTGGQGGGGGAGGRIAIVVGTSDSSTLSVQVDAGTGTLAGVAGGAGVAAYKGPGATNYNLTIGDLSFVSGSSTPITGASPSFGTITLGDAIVSFDAGSSVNVNSIVALGSSTISASNLNFGSGGSFEIKNSALASMAAQSITGGALNVRSGGTFRQMNTTLLTFASVLVEAGGLITHSANSTSRSFVVNLGTTGDFNLQAGGTIAANGVGYTGGAGYQVSGSGPGGGGGNSSSSGNGGGHGGVGGLGANANLLGGAAYDDITHPIDLGSGGGGGYPNIVGGSGGGAIFLNVAGTLFLNGVISANGAGAPQNSSQGSGGGAGGTVNLAASGFSGTGLVQVNGGIGGVGGQGGGGGAGGRIGIAISSSDNSSVGLQIAGGAGGSTGGSAGRTGVSAYKAPGATSYQISGIQDNADILSVPAGTTYTLTGLHSYNVSVRVDGLLLVQPYNGSAGTGALELDAPSVTVSSGGIISAAGAGYGGGQGPGAGSSGYNGVGGGGGYGGQGGYGANGPGGASYGSLMQPQELGSGGAPIYYNGQNVLAGGAGGGSLKIVASTVHIDGRLLADGSVGTYTNYYGNTSAGGSGGSILINATQFEGSGTLSSAGGPGINGQNGPGAGGGGRIAVNYGASSFTGVASALGAVGFQTGGAGTVVLGTVLRVDNGGVAGATTTILSGNYSLDSITFTSHAIVDLSTGANFSVGNVYVQAQSTVVNRGNLSVANTVSVGGGGVFNQESGSLSAALFDPQAGGEFRLDAGTITVPLVNVEASGVMYVNMTLQAPQIEVKSGGLLTHDPGVAAFQLIVPSQLKVDAGGAISATGAGYGSGQGPGPGTTTNGASFAALVGGGGGYGGQGGSNSNGPGGITYGSFAQPQELGSGGSPVYYNGQAVVNGGRGGGKLSITAGTLDLEGVISADGVLGGYSNYYGNTGAGGSGGAVLINVSQLEGSGTISANGGPGINTQNGPSGGGGGRIALYYSSSTASLIMQAKGGIGTGTGANGTIINNGQPVTASTTTAGTTVAFSQMQEHLSSGENLSETVNVQLMDFAGGISTGATSGTLGVANLYIATIKTGSFANQGFFHGQWSLVVGGSTLTGTWKGMAYFTATPRQINLKGVLEGDIRGTLDGVLQESTSGSGVFDRMSVNSRSVQIAVNVGAGDIYFSGSGVQRQTTDYPGTPLTLLQTSLTGALNGYYTGPLDTTLTYLRVSSPGNPFNGEGMFIPTYSSNLGPGSGWAYAITTDNQSAQIAGFLQPPLRGLLEGSITLNAPRSLLVTVENLDNGLAFLPMLNYSVSGPLLVIPGRDYSFTVTLRNDGYVNADGVSLVIAIPDGTVLNSATGNYVIYTVGGKPFIRWDIPHLLPRSSFQNDSYVLHVQPVPANTPNTNLPYYVELVTKAWADQVFAAYPVGGTP